MLSALQRIPLDKHQRVAKRLWKVAVGCAIGGLLFVIASSASTKSDYSTSGDLATTIPVPLAERLAWLTVGLVALGVAALCALGAYQLFTEQGRLKKYPPILTGVEAMPIQRIVEITGHSRSQVLQDIQSLIDAGWISDIYIDNGRDQVISKVYIPKVSHKKVVVCPNCHAPNDVIVGITRRCDDCLQPLVMGEG